MTTNKLYSLDEIDNILSHNAMNLQSGLESLYRQLANTMRENERLRGILSSLCPWCMSKLADGKCPNDCTPEIPDSNKHPSQLTGTEKPSIMPV